MATLRNGSSGADVKKLQQSLISAGYSVGSSGADGIYGANTAAAVRRYQQDNGLAVDGIAGRNTLGKLYSAPAASNPTKVSAPSPSYTYDSSTNEAYQKALEALKQAQGQAPKYAGTYDQQVKDLYDKVANREKFSYDLNGDALYQQYKDKYTTLGKTAMMDTMGQAAALTGGYGNSYAQNAGQQAYQGYLQQLNDVVPELYSMALDQYNQEGDRLKEQYQMVGDMADTEYNRYLDALGQYWQDLTYKKQEADDAYSRGFNEWNTGYQNQYQAERDRIADEQWQKQFDEAKRQYEQSYALQKQSAAAARSSSSSRSSASGGRSSSGSSASSGYDTHGYSTAQIKALQRAAGLTDDGIWGANTQKAYEDGYRWNSYSGSTTKSGDMNPSNFTAYMRAISAQLSGGKTDAAKGTAQTIANSLSDAQYDTMKKVFAQYGIQIG